MITHDYVISTYLYDVKTGSLTYRKSAGCRKAGELVGWIDGHDVKYLVTKVNGEKVRLHRLIYFYMTGEWPDCIDHINGNSLDNRWENIRNVSVAENCKNLKLMRHNTSGIHGVSWYKNKKWYVYIGSRPRIHIGYFDCFFDACCARKSAEIEHGYHKNHGRRGCQ